MAKLLNDNFRDKKVLVFGLGVLGGGVATTNWLIKHGARVTVTDLKDENYLERSLKRIKGNPKLRLNGHDKKDIEDNEIIVFNPDVSIKNPFVQYAMKLGKQIENEASIFYKLCPRPIIAVTGTRGKTTTTNWVGHFLGAKYNAVVSGNSYAEPMLKTLDRIAAFDFVANEIPSYHLEYFDGSIPPPEIAVITNLYQDHLNRHGMMEDYALAKASIFKNQAAKQSLILNRDSKWTPFFLKRKPFSKIWFFSIKPLPKKDKGVFYKDGSIYFQNGGGPEEAINLGDFMKKWGTHNIENLLAASLAAHIAGVPWVKISKKIKDLPQIQFRQETIFNDKHVAVVNDTAATSPDGGIAAIRRFSLPGTILIAGGTDRDLDYRDWAIAAKRLIGKENLILLDGSATKKIIKALGPTGKKITVLDSLRECVKVAFAKARLYPKSVVLFSPAAKSFEKFKNEFDRGRQFNLLVKKELKS